MGGLGLQLGMDMVSYSCFYVPIDIDKEPV